MGMTFWAPRAAIAGSALFMIFMTSVLVSCPANAESDVLQRPAMQSSRAGSRVMLAVTRADKRIVAVGERGIVMLSDDNGNTWRQAKVPVSVSLTRVWFVNAGKGWAVGHGGVVLHSADGGETWTKQLDGVQAAALMLDAVRGNAGEGDRAAPSRLAEVERLVAEGPDKPFLDVYFSDENHGLIVGAFGLAFATEDGGKHWQPWANRIPNPKGKHLYRIHASGNDVFIAGEQGALFHSSNVGMTFTEVTTPYAGTYFGVLSGPKGEVLVFGLRGNAYWSGDTGQSWQKVDSGSPGTLTAGLRLSDGSLLLVDEAGRLLKSSDGGRRFRRLQEGQPTLISGVAQAADGNLLLAGVRGIMRVAPSTNLAED